MNTRGVREAVMRSSISLAGVALVIAACGGGTEPAGGNPGGNPGGNTCTSTSVAVTVQNNSFSPSCTTVPPGSTITWTWTNASNGHNVTFPAGVNSTTQTTGTFQRAFPTAGTFAYECTVHPGMAGSIRVQ